MGNLILQSSRLQLAPPSQTTWPNNARIVEKLDRIKYYFASRTSAYDDIWNICHSLSNEIHEQVLDIFILTLIDHWDKELERYILLCEQCLILMDFDFGQLETKELVIYDYARFNSIRMGQLIYPQMAFNYRHRSRYAIRFQWDSQKPLNYRDYWNPWSKEIPWITLMQHPLASYIDDLLCELDDPNGQCTIEDQYFTIEYLQQIRRRFSIETFHDKLMMILNSLQPIPLANIPQLSVSQYERLSDAPNDWTNLTLEQSIRENRMLEFHHSDHSDHQLTIVHYAPVLCENYFNLAAMFYNSTNLGYYRLRLF